MTCYEICLTCLELCLFLLTMLSHVKLSSTMFTFLLYITCSMNVNEIFHLLAKTQCFTKISLFTTDVYSDTSCIFIGSYTNKHFTPHHKSM